MNDYTDATTCECGALIECLDSGQGYSYWVHVKRMRIQFDHAAVPVRPVAPFDPTPEDLVLAEFRERGAR